MGWSKARPGQVSESGTESVTSESPDTLAYPGYIPQRYIRPGQPEMMPSDGGASAVPNNTLRGTESHGVQVDSHVGPRDSIPAQGLASKDDMLPQRMPEADDEYEPQPVKVEIVSKDPDMLWRPFVNAYPIGGPTVAGSATNITNGLTPVQILGRDDRRGRTYVTVASFTSGGMNALGVASTPVLITSPTQNPLYGFPLPTTNQNRMEISATEPLWVVGQNGGDIGIVSVYTERAVNADRLQGD